MSSPTTGSTIRHSASTASWRANSSVVALHGVAEEALVRGPAAGRVVGGDQLDVLADELVAGDLDPHAELDADVGAQVQAQVVGAGGDQLPEQLQGRAPELDQDLGVGHRQVLAGADVERHAGPAPGVDGQAGGHVGLDAGVGGHPRLLAVAAELAADDAGAVQRPDRLDEPGALLAGGVGGVDRRRVHGQQGEHLEQVVLEDVADRASLVVEGAPALDPEVLGHGDLHLADVAGVPDRLQQGVGEAQVEDVLDRLLAQEVVHAEDAVLGQVAVQDLVELAGRGQVAAERLLDDHPGLVEAAGGGQPLGHGGEHARRDGQVVQRPLGVAEGLAQPLEGPGVGVVAVDVAQQRRQLGERLLVDLAGTLAVVLQAVVGPLAQLGQRPSRTWPPR